MAVTNAWTTPNSTATMDLATGATVTESIWDNLVSNVYYIGGAAGDLSKSNILVNGGFEMRQRGNGPWTANNNYTVDRWRIALGGGSTISVAPNTSTVDTQSQYSLGMTYTHSSGSSILQVVEDYWQWRGKTLAFSVRAQTTQPSAVRVRIDDSAANGTAGSYHTGTTSFETLSATKTISTAATSITVRVLLDTTCTPRIDNAMLIPGDAPHQYVPLHPADELTRCQRYFELHGGVTNLPRFEAYATGTELHSWPMVFATEKGGIPTLTRNGTWNYSGTSSDAPNLGYQGNSMLYSPYLVPTGAGVIMCAPNSTDDTITIEWNP